MNYIIIGNKNHTLFYFHQGGGTVFLTHNRERAERFISTETTYKALQNDIKPLTRWVHEFKDEQLIKEDLFVWNYEEVIKWNILG